MEKYLLSLLLLLDLMPHIASAQYISFIYDEAGNRIVREVPAQPVSEDIEYEFKSLSFIEENNQSAEIKVYPNPTKDFFHVESDESYFRSGMKLFDTTGRLMDGKIMMQTVEVFDISSLPAGLYILEITGSRGEKTFKIVKQ